MDKLEFARLKMKDLTNAAEIGTTNEKKNWGCSGCQKCRIFYLNWVIDRCRERNGDRSNVCKRETETKGSCFLGQVGKMAILYPLQTSISLGENK